MNSIHDCCTLRQQHHCNWLKQTAKQMSPSWGESKPKEGCNGMGDCNYILNIKLTPFFSYMKWNSSTASSNDRRTDRQLHHSHCQLHCHSSSGSHHPPHLQQPDFVIIAISCDCASLPLPGIMNRPSGDQSFGWLVVSSLWLLPQKILPSVGWLLVLMYVVLLSFLPSRSLLFACIKTCWHFIGARVN